MDNIKIMSRKHQIAKDYEEIVKEREILDKKEKDLIESCGRLTNECGHDVMILTKFNKGREYESYCLFCGLQKSVLSYEPKVKEKLNINQYIDVTKLCKTEIGSAKVYKALEKAYLVLKDKYPNETEKEIAERMKRVFKEVIDF